MCLLLLGGRSAHAATSPFCTANPTSPLCSYCTANPTAATCSYCATNPTDPSCSYCAANPTAPTCSPSCIANPASCEAPPTAPPTAPTAPTAPTGPTGPITEEGDGCYGLVPDFADGTTPLDDDEHVENLCNYVEADWIPNFMAMAEQLTTVMMDQIMIVGTLIDAEDEMETQRRLQVLVAEAHRDYQPDLQMCVLGGNVRSLAAADEKARVNTRWLNLAMLKRDMLSQDMSGSIGSENDFASRFQHFQTTYCDQSDANGGLATICTGTVPPARVNKDINYTDTIESHYTLDVDFTNPAETTDEDDVLALSRNLFAFKNFSPIPDNLVMQSYAKDQYQDERSIEAMRSVAANSFAHIVGMRAAGSDQTDITKPYMDVVLKQLGVPGTVDANPDIDTLLGKNPSYYAQMEVLTHKLYEDPRFFSNLYATPANVERIGATLQALRLMQDRDRYESSLRREMLASVLLELSVRDRQENTENRTISCIYGVVSGC